MEDQAGNNFDTLVYYYENDSVIQNTIPLKKMVNYLINFCELKQEHFPEAIDGFTEVIANPETFEDSVFAIIDLAYAYQLMQNSSGRDFYLGSMPQYCFYDKNTYLQSRQYHLSLIKASEHNEDENFDNRFNSPGHFIQQCYPNPVTELSTFKFIIEQDAKIEIVIFDQLGRLISSIKSNFLLKGEHSVSIDLSSMTPGIYFYALRIDGSITDTGKLIKLSN